MSDDTFKKGTQLEANNIVIKYVKKKDLKGRYGVRIEHAKQIYKPVPFVRLSSAQLLDPRAPENAMAYLKSKQPQKVTTKTHGRFKVTSHKGNNF